MPYREPTLTPPVAPPWRGWKTVREVIGAVIILTMLVTGFNKFVSCMQAQNELNKRETAAETARAAQELQRCAASSRERVRHWSELYYPTQHQTFRYQQITQNDHDVFLGSNVPPMRVVCECDAHKPCFVQPNTH